MEMNTDEPVSVMIQGYWAVIARRKWWMVASIIAGLAVAGALCVVLPQSYRSSTLILVENQKIPDDYVKGIGGGSIEERLTMIQQQVMSRTLLNQIIEEFHLYSAQLHRGGGLEAVIEEMRKAIKVETVGTVGSRGKSVEAITISFSNENPLTAMKVTAKLASLFIEENLKVREQLVTGVSIFLEQELLEAKKALESQEQAISQYKTKHMGLLPEQMEANLRALDRLQADFNATDELIHSQSDRLSMYEKAIKEYEASGSTHAVAGGQPLAHANMDPLVGRLRELERQLTMLKAEYRETYPDVVQTMQEIDGVKKQLVEKYGDPAEEKDRDAAKTFDPYLRELIKQRNELRAEVSSARERRGRIAKHIGELEHRVEQTPSREQELMILMRDYENMQKNYQALLDKRLNAHVAENLEKRQKGEQFRVLDPANLPEKPDKPNRLVIMLAGLMGGCGLGLGLTIGLDQLNPTFKRREEIEVLAGVRVLAAIPNFFTLHHSINGSLEEASVEGSDAGSQVPASWVGWRNPSWRNMGKREQPFSAALNLVSKWQPFSIAAEQYRMAASRLVLSAEGRGCTVLEITSALKGEGKTTTAVNIGYTLARDLGKRTLLLECDFRCPALHQYINVPAHGGLIGLLNGDIPLEDCLSGIDDAPCSILSVERVEEAQNELARIQQVKAILPILRTKYEFIIINAPPVLSSASTGILASLADVLVVVIRAGVTQKHVVQKAFSILGGTGEAQVVLNAVEVASMPNYIYGYAGIYGGKHSSVEIVGK